MQKLDREFVGQLQGSDSIEIGSGLCGSVTVLQFGEGNFLRAFVDWMFDKLNAETDFKGDTVIVQPIEQGRAKELKDAECVYTVLLRGKQGGQIVDNKRIITTVADAISCYDDFEYLCELAVSKDLRFIVSNTTEAGIVYNHEEYTPDSPQKTFPAKLTALLKKRFDSIGDAPGSGLIFLPVELIENNGSTLKSCISKYAADWGFSREFTDWLEDECIFCDTLVDRIVTGYPSDQIDRIQTEPGYKDDNLVAAEIFHLWVIKSNKDIRKELPFEDAGLNVIWTDDLAPYRNCKVRFLNGAHTSSVLAAFHCGLDLVRQMIEDDTMKHYLDRIIFNEISPAVDLSQDEKAKFANAVIERFSNPFVDHRLLDISLNSVSKWAVRVMPTLLDRTAAYGRPPRLLAFSLAALLRFYRGSFKNGRCVGTREESGQEYEIRDDEYVLGFFADQWAKNKIETIVIESLQNEKLWSKKLDTVEGLTEMVTADLKLIDTAGMKAAILNALKEA